MASKAEKYALWLAENEDKKETEQFKTVASAYRELRKQPPLQKPASPPQKDSYDEAVERAQKLKNTSIPELIMGSAPGRFVQGLADMPMAFAQAATAPPNFAEEGSNPAGLNRNPNIQPFTPIRDAATAVHEGITRTLRQGDEMRESGREAFQSEGADLARLGGNIATGVAATRAINPVKGLPNKVAQGSAIGGTLGGLTPKTSEDFNSEQVSDVVEAAGIGGAFPVVGAALRKGGHVVRNLIDPLTEGGLARGARRLVQETTDDIEKLITSLRGAPKGQTVGQATTSTGNTRLSAMAKKLENRASDDFAEISEAQNTARITAIREASGGNAAKPLTTTIDELTASRKAIADPLFEESSKASAKIDPKDTIKVLDRLIKADPNNDDLIPVLMNIRGQLVKPAPKPTGRVPLRGFPDQPPILTQSPRELISSSRNIASIISKKDPVSGKSINENIVRQLSGVKKVLDKTIGVSVPSFKAANEAWKKLSIPVDKAGIGLRLEKKLTSVLAGDEGSIIQQRGAQFVGALADEKALISGATGFKRGSGLEKYFDESEMNRLGLVAKELQDNAELQRLAAAGGKGADRIMSELEGHTSVNALNRVLMVLNAIITRAGSARKEATLNEASKIFQNPKQLADLLEKAKPRELTAFKRIVSSVPIENITRTTAAISATRD